jgi:hypothetical protein
MPSLGADANLDFHIVGGHPESRTQLSGPLAYTGSLDGFEQSDITPAIGREYTGLQVRDALQWDDDRVRDLAATSKYLVHMQPRGTACHRSKFQPFFTIC